MILFGSISNKDELCIECKMKMAGSVLKGEGLVYGSSLLEGLIKLAIMIVLGI